MKVLESLNLLVQQFRLDSIKGFSFIEIPLVSLSGYLDEVSRYISDLEAENRELRKIRRIDNNDTQSA